MTDVEFVDVLRVAQLALSQANVVIVAVKVTVYCLRSSLKGSEVVAVTSEVASHCLRGSLEGDPLRLSCSGVEDIVVESIYLQRGGGYGG